MPHLRCSYCLFISFLLLSNQEIEPLPEVYAKSGQQPLKRPQSASTQRRPVTDYAKIASAMGDQNPRYKSDNILSLKLDMPERTTYDYEGAASGHRMQAALNAAFGDSQSQGQVYLWGDQGAAQPRRPRSARRSSAGE